MTSNRFNGLDIQNVKVNKSHTFDGHIIKFSVGGQNFVLMTGNSKSPFPMSIKHEFMAKEICNQCSKQIYPADISIQLCSFFQQRQHDLLRYILRFHQKEFQ
jgi:hypothetical protein